MVRRDASPHCTGHLRNFFAFGRESNRTCIGYRDLEEGSGAGRWGWALTPLGLHPQLGDKVRVIGVKSYVFVRCSSKRVKARKICFTNWSSSIFCRALFARLSAYIEYPVLFNPWYDKTTYMLNAALQWS